VEGHEGNIIEMLPKKRSERTIVVGKGRCSQYGYQK
jgi:hypothetical protein